MLSTTRPHVATYPFCQTAELTAPREAAAKATAEAHSQGVHGLIGPQEENQPVQNPGRCLQIEGCVQRGHSEAFSRGLVRYDIMALPRWQDGREDRRASKVSPAPPASQGPVASEN